MNNQQAASIISEAIKQAAREMGVTQKEAYDPPTQNKEAIAARNIAMRIARDQGLPTHVLAEGFRRDRKTVTAALHLSKP